MREENNHEIDGHRAAEALLVEKSIDAVICASDILAMGVSFTIEETVQSFVDTLYDDEYNAKYMAGIAFHGYSNNDMEDFESGPLYVEETYGGKTFFTDVSEGTWSLDFGRNLSYGLTNVVLGGVNCGMKTILYWNLALYDDGTGSWRRR